MLPKISDHTEWVSPHSVRWYAQLAKQEGVYRYPWSSTVEGPNGETVFADEVRLMVPGRRVLDIGCAHGEFTLSLGSIVKEIVGFDVIEEFLPIDQLPPNVSFIVGNSKDGLPFEEDMFDCAYNRKGPTSAYPDLRRVVKKGGRVIGIHPGDDLCKELPEWFPGLFDPLPISMPILHNLKEKLISYKKVDIQQFNTVEFLHSPIDVIRMRTFGQKNVVYEDCFKSLPTITAIFERHATEKGLPVTFSRYLLTATV